MILLNVSTILQLKLFYFLYSTEKMYQYVIKLLLGFLFEEYYTCEPGLLENDCSVKAKSVGSPVWDH